MPVAWCRASRTSAVVTRASLTPPPARGPAPAAVRSAAKPRLPRLPEAERGSLSFWSSWWLEEPLGCGKPFPESGTPPRFGEGLGEGLTATHDDRGRTVTWNRSVGSRARFAFAMALSGLRTVGLTP